MVVWSKRVLVGCNQWGCTMTLRFNPEHNEMQVIIYAEKNLRLAVGHEAFSAAEQYYACGSLLKVIVLAKKKMFSFLILNAHTQTHTNTHPACLRLNHISGSLGWMDCYWVEEAPHGDAPRTLMNTPVCLGAEHMDRERLWRERGTTR